MCNFAVSHHRVKNVNFGYEDLCEIKSYSKIMYLDQDGLAVHSVNKSSHQQQQNNIDNNFLSQTTIIKHIYI